jgi:hypothetical protein
VIQWQQVPHTCRFSVVFRAGMGGQRPQKGMIRLVFADLFFQDLIIDLDTLWGDVHGVQISGKSEKLLFLAISISMAIATFSIVSESGPIDRMITYLRTQLGDLSMV